MHKLVEVREAKELMKEAMGWSTFRWLLEKARVRKAADEANAALDHLERAVKSRWSEKIKTVYKSLSAKHATAGSQEGQNCEPDKADSELRSLLEEVKQAHDAARHARTDAENTFEEAERKMSVGLAREGCKKAIHSWELYERAIRKAEAIGGEAHAKE